MPTQLFIKVNNLVYGDELLVGEELLTQNQPYIGYKEYRILC